MNQQTEVVSLALDFKDLGEKLSALIQSGEIADCELIILRQNIRELLLWDNNIIWGVSYNNIIS